MMGKGERHRGIKKGGDHTGLEIIYANSKIIVSITMKAGEKKKNSNIEAHIYTYVSVNTHTYMHICTEIMIN